MTIYKVVLDQFNKKVTDGSNKTIAEALLEGSLTEKDLIKINDSFSFPANTYNTMKLPEGAYSTQEAMMSFVILIAPYLSEHALYLITHRLTKIEAEREKEGMYRNSTLAKCFLMHELEQHSIKEGQLPAVFLRHMKEYVLPVASKCWSLESLMVSMNNIVKTFNVNFNGYDQIAQFKLEQLNPDNLSRISPNPEGFFKTLHALSKEYEAMTFKKDKTEENKKTDSKSKRFSFRFSNFSWGTFNFGSKNQSSPDLLKTEKKESISRTLTLQEKELLSRMRNPKKAKKARGTISKLFDKSELTQGLTKETPVKNNFKPA